MLSAGNADCHLSGLQRSGGGHTPEVWRTLNTAAIHYLDPHQHPERGIQQQSILDSLSLNKNPQAFACIETWFGLGIKGHSMQYRIFLLLVRYVYF